MKRGDFEEVPRLAGMTMPASRLARRWAGIAEAPPVADEARRFRGSAPAGGHDNASQPAGTTVGRNRKPLQALSVTFGDSSPRGRAKWGPLPSAGRVHTGFIGADDAVRLYFLAILRQQVICHDIKSRTTSHKPNEIPKTSPKIIVIETAFFRLDFFGFLCYIST